jgi:CHAT domain-containing protein
LLGSDIARRRFQATRTVILASCEGAIGRIVDGEGVMSLASMFVTAGVPTVVAALWPVDDRATLSLLTAFHVELRQSGDAARALQSAQLSVLLSGTSGKPVRGWAGFMVFGGIKS